MKANTDYSYLFNSLSTNSNSKNNSSINLGIDLLQYAQIKDGSFLIATKALYAKNGEDSFDKNSSVKKEANAKELLNIKEESEALKDSADKLLKKGSNSLFSKKDITITNEDGTTSVVYDYDMEAITKGVESFISDYNALIKSGGDSNSEDVLKQIVSMTQTTENYSSYLSKVGITINADNTLSMDKEAFQESEVSSIKTLFQNRESFGYTISSKASYLDYTAGREIDNSKNYNFNGDFSNDFSSGNIYNKYS